MISTSTAEIRLAVTDAEREAIARLRYDVYVAEMGRPQPCADHDARAIHEPSDGHGMVFGAFLPGGHAVGTLRITPATQADDAQGRFYGWQGFLAEELAVRCMASKLIVASAHRGSRLGIKLIKAATAHGMRKGVRYCYLDTNAHLIDFYRAIGFVARHVREHPLFGTVTVMVWDLYDLEHMRRVHSPLLAEVSRHVPAVHAA